MIKQTQTKFFDFSDIGLDFCAGSKSLFPDRFKKIFATGYNTKTVSSVAVAGNQVTLTYGVSHGYAAGRVLKLNAPELLGINGGEFYIDSVTTNTVVLTIDNPPAVVSGGFTTYVAPLGMQLVYEVGNIHVYKFKALDESDLYLRLCFQDNSTYRNRVSPCVGTTYDPATGVITDVNSFQANKAITTPSTFSWEFSYNATSAHDNYSSSQGTAIYGKGILVGSLYHLAFNYSTGSSADTDVRVSGLFPCVTLNYQNLSLPILIGEENATASGAGAYYQFDGWAAYIGGNRCIFDNSITQDSVTFTAPPSSLPITSVAAGVSSFLPSSIDSFNTTTAAPIPLYLRTSRQFIGYLLGMYQLMYSTTNTPSKVRGGIGQNTIEADFSNAIYVFGQGYSNAAAFYGLPLEEIKIGA